MKVFLPKFHWDSNNGIHVTGFIREKDKYLRNNELVEYFADIDSVGKLKQKLKSANGQFSVVIERTDKIWAATDRLRNYPLFYTHVNGEFLISDDCYLLAEKIAKLKLNPLAVDCFLSAGYTVNNLTLVGGVFQIEAGEYLQVGSQLLRKFYYDSSLIPVSERDFYSASEELSSLFDNLFENHFKALSDKFVVIPLSGGFDSRLIAVMCKRYHPENVLCYTYGTENNCEVEPAKEVASRLGFKWINIIYNSELIDGYLEDGTFKEYYTYVSNLSSMFFMQEYFAVKYLKDNQLVPENSVFMPGFSGDVLAGSHLSPEMKKLDNRDKVSASVFNHYFDMVMLNNVSRSDIISQVKSNLNEGKTEPWRMIEEWDIKERQAKFVVNSAKVFTFFGYEYVLPLFDNILIDFFSVLAFNMKINKRLYDHVLTEFVFKEPDLNFPDELNPTPLKKEFQRIKESIKKHVPNLFKEHFITSKSPIYYDQITKYMIDALGSDMIIKPRQSNYYNSYITQWYLAKTREYLRQ